MALLNMERIAELHRIWDRETAKFLRLGPAYGSPHPLFLHERDINAVDFTAMSLKWNDADEDELRLFVELQQYIAAEADGQEEVLPPKEKARHFVTAAEESAFEDYVHGRVLQIHRDREDETVVPWREAVAEEWDDQEVDLQEDAGRRGLASDN